MVSTSEEATAVSFTNGARLAIILTINIGYWEKSRPGQKEPLFTGPLLHTAGELMRIRLRKSLEAHKFEIAADG